MTTSQPRKVRKAQFNLPHHAQRKAIASHLSEDLLLKYNRRRLTVITGDEVKILRGDHKGRSGRVASVDSKGHRLVIDGVTHKKADGTEVALPVHPSNVVIVRLNLEDKRRRAKLGETETPKETKAAKEPKAAKKAATTEEPKPAKKATTEEKPQEATA